MEKAADAGDRQAMIHMAKAYESGEGLGDSRYTITPNTLKSSRNFCFCLFLALWPPMLQGDLEVLI